MKPCSSIAKHWLMALLLSSVAVGCSSPKQAPHLQTSAAEPVEVVFVCQYGYGKSLVAAKHFERMAAARGLPVRVVARGLTPKEVVPEALASALRQDGLDIGAYRPIALDASDLQGANFVFAFGVDLPFETGATTARWDDVSALSENYAKARDEIVAHLAAWLDQHPNAKQSASAQP